MGVNAENVKGWLRSKKICVLEEWVQACVEWIHQEHNDPAMSGSQLCKMVYDQWLNSDLSEIATPCLPAAITQARSTKLNGSFALQVNSIQDISSPAYGQLVKLQGRENENALVTAVPPTQSKFEPKPSRLLMLTLTDGQQMIQAMEYKPVSCLRLELPPGTKVLLSGDMRCRLGVILLTSVHVKILGGEVEALKETNSQERLLARAIGITPPDRPVGGLNQDQDQDQGLNQVPQPTTNNTSVSSWNNSVATNPTGRSNMSNNAAPTSLNQTRNRNSTQSKTKQEVKTGSPEQRSWGQGGQRPVVDEFPDDLDGIDEQMLEELEMIERQQEKQVKKEAPAKKTEDVVWGEEDFDEEELLLAMEWENSVQPKSRLSTNTTSKPQNLARNNQGTVRLSSNSNGLQSSCSGQRSSDNAFKPQGHTSNYTVPQQQGRRMDDTSSKPQVLSRGCTAQKPQEFRHNQGSGRLSVSGVRPQTNVSTSATNIKREQNMSASAMNSNRTQNHLATVAMNIKNEPQSQGDTSWIKPQPKTSSSSPSSLLLGNNTNEKTQPKATAFATNAVPLFRTNKDGSAPLQTRPKFEPVMNPPHIATGAANLVGRTEDGSNSDMTDSGSHKMGGSFSSIDRAANKMAAGSRMAVATRFIKDEPQSQQTSSSSSTGSDPKRRKVERASLPRPFVYLIHQADQLKRKEECQFDIKGFIMTLVSSLSHNPTWSLTAKINDGTMSLDVDISEQVLAQLIGFTVKDMMQMKADMKHSDQKTAMQIKNHIKQGISQCQQALMEFSCIMTLEMKPGYGRPKMTAFRQPTMDDVKMLRDIDNAVS